MYGDIRQVTVLRMQLLVDQTLSLQPQYNDGYDTCLRMKSCISKSKCRRIEDAKLVLAHSQDNYHQKLQELLLSVRANKLKEEELCRHPSFD